MNQIKQSILRSPTILGLGLCIGLCAYGYSYINLDMAQGNSQGVEEFSQVSLFWNDRHQDLNVAEIETILAARLPKSQLKRVKPLARHIQAMAQAYAFSPSLILAVIQTESTFKMDARSPVGAVGLMQVLPSTAKYIAHKWNIGTYKKARDLNDPFVNITIGVAYLAYLRERFENPMHYVAAYNLGPTTVGRMLDENNFVLGKVTKYVTDIHSEANQLRKNSASLVAQN